MIGVDILLHLEPMGSAVAILQPFTALNDELTEFFPVRRDIQLVGFHKDLGCLIEPSFIELLFPCLEEVLAFLPCGRWIMFKLNLH
jgi:hypothetical protein